MPQLTPRPYADVIKAWADGAQVQCRRTDLANSQWSSTDYPSWTAPTFEYRIKPEPVTTRYRLALLDARNGSFTTVAATTDVYATYYEGRTNFVRWLGDWQEVEV